MKEHDFDEKYLFKMQNFKPMKTIFFLLCLIFISITSKSQVVVDSINGNIYLKNIYEIDLTKTELQQKANKWVAKTYNNSNYVTRINNEDNILTKGSFQVGADFTAYGATIYSSRKVEYTLDLQFKDGRYKIEIIDLQVSADNIPQEIGIFLLTPEQYKKMSIEALSNYDGPGKNAAIKRLNNDKKFMKDYNSTHDYGEKIIPQIINELENIDSSLLSYMNSDDDNDDW